MSKAHSSLTIMPMETFAGIAADILGRDLDLDRPLSEQGFDSLATYEFLDATEEAGSFIWPLDLLERLHDPSPSDYYDAYLSQVVRNS